MCQFSRVMTVVVLRMTSVSDLLSLRLLCILLVAAGASTAPPSDESRLISQLLVGYERQARPALNSSEAVDVDLGLTLQKVTVDLPHGKLLLDVWVSLSWRDPQLNWNESDYGGVSSIRLRPDQVWMPDIMPYNTFPSSRPDWMAPTLVVIESSGSILYVGPSRVVTECRRDFHNLRSLSCDVKLGSWVYNGFQLNLTSKSSSADLSSYVTNKLWDLETAKMRLNEVYYSCCPEPYQDVVLTVNLRVREHFLRLPNLPVTVANLLMLTSFLVPVTSPQKLTLPCLSLVTVLAAALTSFQTSGDAVYEAFLSSSYHLNVYWLLAFVIWEVLMVLMASCGRHSRWTPTWLRSCLSSRVVELSCCLPSAAVKSAPEDEEPTGAYSCWMSLASFLDRCMGGIFFVLLVVAFVNFKVV